MNTQTTSLSQKSGLGQLLPVMLCFFAMGFVDLVGVSSNYIKQDLALSDTIANTLPSLVFFWFLIFSVPTGLLMNRIGRKNTVLLSLLITLVSLILPIFGENFGIMLVAFSLLGIANAIMQTSLNPLVSNLISAKSLPSALTFGQFVKAIASFLAPVIASWGAVTAASVLGLSWRVLFPIYAVVCLLSVAFLFFTPIKEEPMGKASSVVDCLKLLKNPVVLMMFFGVFCHVGIDVGTNTTAPKVLMERLQMPLEEAAFATSVYFIFRTIGSLSGAFILKIMPSRIFLLISALMIGLGMTGLILGDTLFVLYASLALIGFGNSNVFSIVFSYALLNADGKENEVSGLMIMGLFGGTIFPLAMGFASDCTGSQVAAVAFMLLGVVYLASLMLKMKKA